MRIGVKMTSKLQNDTHALNREATLGSREQTQRSVPQVVAEGGNPSQTSKQQNRCAWKDCREMPTEKVCLPHKSGFELEFTVCEEHGIKAREGIL
jgi:hypothetical protein